MHRGDMHSPTGRVRWPALDCLLCGGAENPASLLTSCHTLVGHAVVGVSVETLSPLRAWLSRTEPLRWGPTREREEEQDACMARG